MIFQRKWESCQNSCKESRDKKQRLGGFVFTHKHLIIKTSSRVCVAYSHTSIALHEDSFSCLIERCKDGKFATVVIFLNKPD